MGVGLRSIRACVLGSDPRVFPVEEPITKYVRVTRIDYPEDHTNGVDHGVFDQGRLYL